MTIKPTFEIVLFRPEIPPNTGNIIRLCANTGSRLHLIRPLGFDLSNKSLRRAGLDYKKNVEIIIHNNLNNFFEKNSQQNIYMFTKFGNTSYEKVSYKRGDFFLFGSESKGFTDEVFKIMKNRIKIFIDKYMPIIYFGLIYKDFKIKVLIDYYRKSFWKSKFIFMI